MRCTATSWADPGDMVHGDIKKLGRIPTAADGASTAARRARRTGKASSTATGTSPTPSTTARAWPTASSSPTNARRQLQRSGVRANAYFESVGITVQRVLTDNGGCYVSKLFAATLGETIVHKRTPAYRPQTNGKV